MDNGLKAFWIIAIAASLIFVIQAILTFVGLGDTDSIDTDAPVDSLDDGSLSGVFSFRNLINFLLGYGWSGVILYNTVKSRVLLYVIAIIVGLLFIAAFVIMFRQIMKLSHDGSFRMEEAVGLSADVYLRIPAERRGRGKIQFSVKGSVHEVDAVTDNSEELPTGSSVKILEVLNDDLFLVGK